ncbi:MAG: transcription termination/antitermination protein NusG [Clostridia bacterium]|nr:transcription termination/antitermination protein NusG [Clostridia bacterium]
MSEQKEPQWYVIHTYSGYENKVKTTLEKLVENRGLTDMITEVLVPTEEVVEIKDGKTKVTQQKKFAGYVFVKMIYNEEIWYYVRNTRGVTGFVGPNANRPLPLTDEDCIAMGLVADITPVVNYEVGDMVRVIAGPFQDQVCKVESIDSAKQQVTVNVTMFGRVTPVKVDFVQVTRFS